MKQKNNPIIQEAKESKRLFNYEIAKILGVSEMTYYRMMRSELPVNEQKEIAKQIEQYVNGVRKDEGTL